jgi:hypothetical protein
MNFPNQKKLTFLVTQRPRYKRKLRVERKFSHIQDSTEAVNK